MIADGDALQKAGALDATTSAVVAQSYYLSGNKAGCLKYIKAQGGDSEAVLQLEMKCAFDINDSVTQRDALEKLVARTGKARLLDPADQDGRAGQEPDRSPSRCSWSASNI